MISSLKNNKKKLLVSASIAVILIAALVVVMTLTKPYAVYANGTKVDNPYAVKAGNEELFLVKDSKTAEKVIETVMDEYSPDGAQINSITVDKKLSSEAADLKRSGEPETVLTADEAVDYVLTQNSTDDPLFSVTITSEVGSLQNVAAGTTYEENKDMYEGNQKVKSEGKNGNQIVTNQTISVNGSVITSEVVDTAVVSEAVNAVVYKGTKEKKTAITANDKSGSAMGGTVIGSGSGAAVASYGLQFVGNPYKYGGTSLIYTECIC